MRIGGSAFNEVEPADVPGFVEQLLAEHQRVLIAWDAPLSFDPANGFSDRPVDREVRAWVADEVAKGTLAKGAVSVLPFAGCPHWTISCAALGMPFGTPLSGLKLATTASDGDKLVVEVHPAVSLARWWVADRVPEPMPRYKRGKGVRIAEVRAALGTIRASLGRMEIPEAAIADDDHLDAWIAWRMGAEFVRGRAVLHGSSHAGAYVLPAATKHSN